MATGNITRLEGVWPETHERAVRDSAGVNLETKLGNINSDISQLSQEVNGGTEVQEYTSHDYATESGYGISSVDGTKPARASWFASDYIPVPGGITIAFKSRQATSYGIAFYSSNSEDSFISGNVGTGAEYSIVVPQNANYFRFCDYQSGRDGYVKWTIDNPSLSDRISVVEESANDSASKLELINNACFDSKIIVSSGQKILGLGASFMRGNAEGKGTANVWLDLLASRLGVECVNDASGGTNIMYHANRLYDGTILGIGNAPISEIGAVLIMHTHNKDVFTLPKPYASYTVAEYEANVLPFSTTEGSTLADVEYAKAFDYIIKKVKALYFADKEDTEYASAAQSYVGQYYFKPAQIVLCTHWHDGRTIYNNSVRKLCLKWGLPLVQFDKKIGIIKTEVNPAYGYQESIQYTGNVDGASPVETIDGVVYGWHPMCGNRNVYIQRKLAAIAEDSFSFFRDEYFFPTSTNTPNSRKAISANDGTMQDRSSWYASNFLPVHGGVNALLKIWQATTFGIAFYSAANESSFISGVAGTGSEQEITIPANAAYFRFCDYGYSTRTGYLKYSI